MKIYNLTALTVLLLLCTKFSNAQRGKEGDVTIAGNTTVNTFTYLTSNVSPGASTIFVNNNSMTGGAFGSALAAGDLIMIIQMQGATMDINTTPTVAWAGNYTVPNDFISGVWDANPHLWGQIMDYGNSGVFERLEVLSVSGSGTINLNCQVTKTFISTGHVQVIRIPRYNDLTIPAGNSITTTNWNGDDGGIVAIEVNGALTINGTITATGNGFRGGELDPNSLTAAGPPSSIRRLGSFNDFEGSEKGEGIGGFYTEYDLLFSRYGIGAPANGGGGGGYQNAGGGGGSNVLVGGTYTSKGNPIGYPAVWNLEAAGFGGSTSAGGGRGGYAISDSDQNELVVGPANAAWGGDDRKNTGGFGGHPLPFVADRVFAGGGGGAGDQDSDQGGAGGSGGGIVFIQAYGTVTGSGTIDAQGASGQNTNPTNQAPTGGSARKGVDGAGGGGGGGAVHIENLSAIPASITINVSGGDGGDQNITLLNVAPLPPLSSEAAGPGGSGSGGLIRIGTGAPTKIFAAGIAGVTTSSHMVNFPPNGATAGSAGFCCYPNNPTYNIITTDQSICSGSTASLVASLSGTGSPLPSTGSFVWYDAMVGGTQVSTGTTFTTPSLTTTTTYWVGICPGTFRTPVIVTISPADDASFSYTGSPFCANGADPTPTITGLAGGTFSSTAGLSINASTGTIDVSTSTPGAYTVTYLTSGPCPNSSTQAVTIAPLDDASFSYASASYCVSEADPTPTITGLAGGTFSSTAGLSINASTGIVDLSTSTPGVYTVTYATSGPCPNSAIFVLTITTLEDASFTYSAASYCIADADPTPTITGVAGGTFTSTAGLSINGSTGIIDLSASIPGAYSVTYTSGGSCPNSSIQAVTITALDDASFSYSALTFCVNATDPTPTITGVAGGTFSSTAGLSINASTGLVDVSTSIPGAYTVTYTTTGACSNSSNVSLTINALDDATFNYSAATYCVDATDPTPTITGLAGGTFSSTAGLSINASTGVIDVSASIPGVYLITYTTSGSCPNSSTANVTINALDDASFNYSSPSYCASGTDPTPTITGLAGGTFASTAGLSINASTGVIDVSASIPGAYTVTYTTAGACPNSSAVAVSITALDDASFNYLSAAYCVNATDPTPTITGVPGGTFTSTAGLSINAATGAIDVSASTPGTYTVTYATTGACANSANVSVTINALDDATFSYMSAAYCVNDLDPTPTITGLAGGAFSSTAGLVINATTGIVDLSASTPGAYTITYTTAGTCPNSSGVGLTVNAIDDASFTYASPSYCLAQADPTPTITGLAGGTFSSTAGLSINASTGTIDVSVSTPGSYVVTYATAGPCPNTAIFNIGITALDDAGFSYSAAAYCADATDPTPTVTGVAGGTFTSAAGLSINAGTGVIDVSASTPGSYTVTYATTGICANSTNVSVTINALDDASFNYSAAAYCADAIDPAATITGLAGGTFSSTAGLSINTSTGAIDVSVSTPGAYTITYTTAGTCPNSSTVGVTINALDDATFSYSAAAYCADATDPAATITGLAGGTFSSAAGLSMNATTGAIDVSASTPGAYTITYTTAGTCPNSSTASVTINALDDATFSYSAAAYCVNATDPSATITGLAGGTFSSTAGLSINASTGVIDVSASIPGAYTVTYTTAGTCINSSTASVTINALDDASFSYAASTYCINVTDPNATITGLVGGTFSSTAGLSINASTGIIDVSASTPGAYVVTYTTAGPCPNSSTANITINALDDASFSYSSATYCADATDPAATITGLAGGTFSSAAGLSMNATTGAIDVSASTPGAYVITYTTAGACPNTTTVNVTINALDDATFNYGAAAYCADATDPNPTISGLAGGAFTSTAGLSINAGTGQVDVSASTPGTYIVTYTTSGTCPNSSTASVTINALDDPSFSYASVSYCISGPDPSGTITGLAGGTFTSTAGLVINASTGQIDVSASTMGAYTVTYTTNGVCPNSTTAPITILSADDAVFTMTATCGGGTASAPGTSGGVFSLVGSPVGVNIDSTTGTVTGGVSNTTYTVQYATSGACASSSTENFTVLTNPLIDVIADQTACDQLNLSTITGIGFSGDEAYYDDSQANGGSLIVGPVTSTQTVYVYATNSGCTNEISFIVTINTTDDPSFTLADYCEGSSNSASITGTAGGTFTFNPAVADGATINGATGEITSGVPGTTYSIEYITVGACPANSIESVLVFAIPLAPSVSTDQSYCAGDVILPMTASTPSGTLNWYDDFGLINNIGTGTSHAPFSGVSTSTYYVTSTDNGCEGPESAIVITIEECDIIIPTAFTPDGDGANDDWELVNIDVIYPANIVRVYNRWGNLVFESPQGDYDNNRWDGTFNGEILPVGSYYYIVEPNLEGAISKSGSVSVILGN
ncbi:MAG: gliding motility-associated C-terminal domain-containing protein [Crocinitomicaceae bacterium]|nr:gliding motility-associated C-terminal domain-containing protein [Flavobacteriales bacterium]NQZ35423.1 gliding motility-associated C-terminal domain-containing protein [Crocinitomicaceae bacterium]